MFKIKKLIVCLLGVVLVAGLVSPFSLEAGKCEAGYVECVFDAIIATVINPALGFAWLTFCAIGYAWCLEFME